jgi:hypothetical protein
MPPHRHLLVALALVPLVIAIGQGEAVADPALPRVITAPTAWLPAPGGLVATAGGGVGAEGFGYGLGDLAALEVGVDRDVRGCAACGGDGARDGLWLGRAAFRLGVRQDTWLRGMPALVVGLRTTWAARAPGFERTRTADLHVVASRVLGPVRLHAGLQAIDAAHARDGRDVRLGRAVRPVAGLEWTPRDLPRSTLLVDVAWLPRLASSEIALERVAGLGVRYQALTWGAIELSVRNREGDGLEGTTVMMRVHGMPARTSRAAATE